MLNISIEQVDNGFLVNTYHMHEPNRYDSATQIKTVHGSFDETLEHLKKCYTEDKKQVREEDRTTTEATESPF